MEITRQYIEKAMELYWIDDTIQYRIMGDYSGRGMFGRKCLAITVERYPQLITIVAAMIAMKMRQENEAPHSESLYTEETWQEFLSTFNTDNMGRGYVMYWPDWSLAE